MKKIPKKYTGLVMGVLMGITMGFTMSFIVTVLNLGFVDDFFIRWMTGFASTLPIGFPIALVITPLVKKLAEHITE